MLIKLRLQCIGNVCCVLVYSQSVYSTQRVITRADCTMIINLVGHEFTSRSAAIGKHYRVHTLFGSSNSMTFHDFP